MIKKIAFANTLKPVDDVRTFEKLAQTIAKTNKYEVNIIGNSGKKESGNSHIHFHPIPVNRKSLAARVINRYKTLRLLLRLKPDLLIIGTHELLIVAFILKFSTNTSVIYDVREDYKKNIIHLSELPIVVKHLAGKLIRLKEQLFSISVDSFWLAERCYDDELNFTKKQSVTLENMCKNPNHFSAENSSYTLLFSGSISHYSQVLLAIDSYQKLKQENKEVRLKIIGQFHDENLGNKLRSIAETDANIELEISTDPVPHELITEAIEQADLGIISYQENAVNRNKMPTKLYEYSRHQLPYLIQSGTKWEAQGRELGGAISVDFASPDITFIFDKLQKRDILFPKDYPKEATWESQEAKILQSIESLSK